ncbi:MAG: hypothetical protein IKQ29_02990 [Bacilli bacterium]|nr:hypothetical protein [Bacilli bacterium]
MKKIKIIIVLFLFLLLSSCGIKGELHTEEELREYTDDLICNPRTEQKCDLKNKYILEKILEKNEEDREVDKRTLLLKLKGLDLEFETTSSLHCTETFDATCTEEEYQMTSNYSEKIFEYYITEYEKIINYNERLCYEINRNNETKCDIDSFVINNKEELNYFIEFYKGLLNYLNNQEYKVPTHIISINIKSNNRTYYLSLGIELLDNQYYPIYESSNVPLDGNIETYIDNYLYKEGIQLN